MDTAIPGVIGALVTGLAQARKLHAGHAHRQRNQQSDRHLPVAGKMTSYYVLQTKYPLRPAHGYPSRFLCLLSFVVGRFLLKVFSQSGHLTEYWGP